MSGCLYCIVWLVTMRERENRSSRFEKSSARGLLTCMGQRWVRGGSRPETEHCSLNTLDFRDFSLRLKDENIHNELLLECHFPDLDRQKEVI